MEAQKQNEPQEKLPVQLTLFPMTYPELLAEDKEKIRRERRSIYSPLELAIIDDLGLEMF